MLTPQAASAQSAYPDKPIHFIVAFVPGGATDTFARQISNDLQEALGQPVVIENRPGAGGYLAWNHVASSDPDGYTLLLAENAVAISQALYKKSKSNFDPITQYDAVAGLAASPSALVVANNVPVKTVAELLAYSKTVPQKMNFASAGVGTVSHLNFEVFMDKTGMQAVHVPYKGGGQAIGDVIAGHVPMTITSVQAVKGLVESGKIKALAVTSPARSPAMPDVPTMQEAGVPPADVELRFWFAIFGPKGLPDAVKAKLSQAVTKVMTDPKVASASPSSTSRRTSSPARRCTPSSKARSRTGPASSTPRASRRNRFPRRKCRIRDGAPPYRRQTAPVVEWPRRSTHEGNDMRRFIRWCSIIGLLLGVVPLAQAQGTYPDRPIQFVVAFPPGGATDTFFRQISNELRTALGQTIVIENKGGAGGYIAWQYVASAPPDGYTVLVAENALGINQALFKKHPSGFDPLRDYDAVAAMGSTPLVWTVANNVPANNFKEFVAWSKTVPGKFNYGHAGPGSVSHLVPEVILDGAGMQAVPVPFKGGGPAARRSPADSSPWSCPPCRSPRPRSKASSSKAWW